MEIEELSQTFEQSFTLEELKYEEKCLDQELASVARRKAAIQCQIEKQLPNLMDVQSRKRKVQVLEDEEFNCFASLIGENPQIEEGRIAGAVDEISEMPQPRKVYSEEIKKRAVELCNKYGITMVSDRSKIHSSCLKRWVKASESNIILKPRGRKVKYPQLEEDLLKFIKEKRAQYKPVTSRIVIAKGKSIAKVKKFEIKCTWGWFIRFLKRNIMVLRTPTSTIRKPLSELELLAKSFTDKFKEILQDG